MHLNACDPIITTHTHTQTEAHKREEARGFYFLIFFGIHPLNGKEEKKNGESMSYFLLEHFYVPLYRIHLVALKSLACMPCRTKFK